jgi:hypothetical protein
MDKEPRHWNWPEISAAGENQVNASLIEIVHDLYEALEAARHRIKILGAPSDETNNTILAQIDAALALAKAEGWS